VFVFKFPEDPQRDFIKRVIALPGDAVGIRDKVVSVGGVPRAEPRTFHSDARTWPDDREVPDSLRRRDQMHETRMASESYFAMGDNRDSSYDSRFWGPVPAGNVKGRALFVYWSLASSGPGAPRGLVSVVADFFRRTRWTRSFSMVR
jgi:signal peptidase I